MEHRHTRYLELLAAAPIPRGDWRQGEIEHVPEPERFIPLEERLMERYRSRGMPEQFGCVGVMHEDEWFVIFRHPVLYPPKQGDVPIDAGHISAVYRGESLGQRSLFLLLLLPDGRLLLNLTYRRPSGTWKLEGQGRITRIGETLDTALSACVEVETGAVICSVTPLGFIASDRGLVGPPVPLFLVGITKPMKPIADPTIAAQIHLSPVELDQAFLKGSFTHEGRTYVCDDSYTAFALYQARLRGLI